MTEVLGDTSFEAALTYDGVIVPRYAQRFGDLLLASIELPARANILDVACRTGYPAVRLLDLARDGRVIALDADGRFLELARARAGEDLGRRIFFKQGPATPLRFGDDVFTNVVINLVDQVAAERRPLLEDIVRVLRPGGQLALSLPLRGSFLEVADMLREVALRFDLPRVNERVEQYCARLPAAEALRAELSAYGFEDAQVHSRAFTLDYRRGADLFNDPVARLVAVPDWRWCAEAAPEPDAVLQRVAETIDVYFRERVFDLTVVAGCVTATRRG